MKTIVKHASPGSVRTASLLVACAWFSAAIPAGENSKTIWDFEADTPGAIAKGFTNEVGRWEVATDGGNHVLYQKAKNDDDTFNVALVQGTSDKDLDFSVRLRAFAGNLDRGGGVVWRAKDRKNYYVARYTTRWRTTSASTRSRTASGPCSRTPRLRGTRSGTPSA
jgi:hypothetical protein